MTSEEFMKLCEELKAQGLTDEDILNILKKMYDEGEIESKDDLNKLAGTLGYELTDEFLAEDGDAEDAKPVEGEMDVPLDEKVEDEQEYDEEESEDEDEGSEDEESEDVEESEDDVEEDEDAEDIEEDDEDEKKQARNLFGLD